MKSPETPTPRWFAKEVQPHEAALRAYLHNRFPSLLDVDDVVQESYLKLLKLGTVEKIASVKGYLFAIARNITLGNFRRNRGLDEIVVSGLDLSDLSHNGVDAAEAASSGQEVDLVIEAISSLPRRCREIVILRALQGFSHREIADQLGLSEQTVRVQVMRGMKKCAQFLRARGVDRPKP